MGRKVAVIGSGNWGSTIARIIGKNVQSLDFEKEVRMWVHEEIINGKNLTEIINTQHENVKYLPGINLSPNIVAYPDIAMVTADADIFVIVLPHQFLEKTLKAMKPHVKKNAYAVTLMKGLAMNGSTDIKLLSDLIRECLEIPCAVLMGANLAYEVSKEMYCEATIAAKDGNIGSELKLLFQTPYFRIVKINDEVTTELCGALKNIVAVAAGVIEGLKYGDNTKAAVIRIGFMEMKSFVYEFFSDRDPQNMTFFESCGFADIITTCYGGRNRKIGIALATSTKPLAQIEDELLGGQSAQGPLTADEVCAMLKARGRIDQYPIFDAVQKICARTMDPKQLIDKLINHPVHR